MDGTEIDAPGHGPVCVFGASSGFGLALAEELTGHGHPVMGAARSPKPPAAGFDYRQVDVTDERSVEVFFEQAEKEFGPPSGVVYSVSNAAAVGNSWELDPRELSSVFEATVFGFARVVRHAVPRMADAGGAILLVGSRAARVPVPTLAAYAAAKASVEHFARCLAQEVEPRGIRVNILGISADTPLAREHLDRRAVVLGRTEPYPALPPVQDNVAAACFLLSQESRFVTGQTIEARQPLWV
ncbi:SDR family oxidoreductase [Catenulispora pinisilvae]|uniref:SDR family oxidoreductase n=1 Tax=Catenulispora pinisilvae TaxID=2705253 RepID=UPI00189188FC|nr:SDR family oxidoreductase [Catenulispora pinisilvae]